MRCGQCNKFVGYDEQDPEMGSLDIDDEGNVTADARVVLACDGCGQELKEASFDFSEQVDVAGHSGEGHGLSAEVSNIELTGRSGYFKKGKFVDAVGRYAKTFYGVAIDYEISCSCDSEFSIAGHFEDDVQASAMEELC